LVWVSWRLVSWPLSMVFGSLVCGYVSVFVIGSLGKVMIFGNCSFLVFSFRFCFMVAYFTVVNVNEDKKKISFYDIYSYFYVILYLIFIFIC
jgi:hypothetical protein